MLLLCEPHEPRVGATPAWRSENDLVKHPQSSPSGTVGCTEPQSFGVCSSGCFAEDARGAWAEMPGEPGQLPHSPLAVMAPWAGSSCLRMVTWSMACRLGPLLVGVLGPKVGSRCPAGGRACLTLLSPEVWPLNPSQPLLTPSDTLRNVPVPVHLSHMETYNPSLYVEDWLCS